MRARSHAEIPDSIDDTNRDSDAPTQLWSGRLSLSSLTPRLRAARHRQRLEALLNTQTGITFELPSDVLAETQPRLPHNNEKAATQRQSTNPPVVTATAPTSSLSGPQLALFVAVGVAIGGIAALHMDHLLHPFAKQAREVDTAQQLAAQPRSIDAQVRDQHAATDGLKHEEATTIHVAVTPAQPARSVPPKQRALTADATLATQANGSAPTPASRAMPPTAGGDDLRIPTQLHPRINPLMTSNQVFKDE